MKKEFIIILILTSWLAAVKAQTGNCKDIKKTTGQTTGVITYTSPVSFLSLTDVVGSSGNTITLQFSAEQKKEDLKASGLYVLFADGSVWKDAGTHIDCAFINTKTGYRYSASKTLHDDDLAIFQSKKITKVQIADVVIPVTDDFATKFMSYISCIISIER